MPASSNAEVPGSTVNFRDPKNRVRVLLRVPRAGDYVLGVYAKREDSPGKCPLVCNYLVLCDSGTPGVVRPFPALPFSKLGPSQAFSRFRLQLLCPKRSCLVVAPFSGKVAFAFLNPDSAELSCDLQHLGRGGGEGGGEGGGGEVEGAVEAGDYVQQTRQGGESVFRARLPEPGHYVLHVFGKAPGGGGAGHRYLLYSALLEAAVPDPGCLPLPRLAPAWTARLHVLAPLRKCLVLGAVTHFAVRAHAVKAVAIVGRSGTQRFVNEDEEGEEEE